MHLAHTKIGVTELAGLEIGDMISTGTPVSGLLPVSLDGAVRFHSRPAGSAKAVQIESLADDVEGPGFVIALFPMLRNGAYTVRPACDATSIDSREANPPSTKASPESDGNAGRFDPASAAVALDRCRR